MEDKLFFISLILVVSKIHGLLMYYVLTLHQFLGHSDLDKLRPLSYHHTVSFGLYYLHHHNYYKFHNLLGCCDDGLFH